MCKAWEGFTAGAWQSRIDVRDFIQKNYTPYDGDDSFLEGPTQDTTDLWNEVLELSKQEREAGGVLDMDTKIISTITSHGPGYLDKSKEKIVGFQTDKPFKRSLQPYGGIRMAVKACEDNGYHVDPEVVEYFTTHRKTHNAGVFDAYTPEMRACRSAHIITGLPDAYGRGRIIGDYRRPALYGVDRLIEDKEEQLATTRTIMYSDVIREREELSEQIRALKMLKELAKIYGCDISKPANNVLEATQAVYFSYLAAVKEQNGAAMSLGRTSTFLDIYAERDLKEGTFTEKEIQEIIESIQGLPNETMISRLTLRTMKQAKYTTQCSGHFGLAAKYYCHFTSPIRRYPDLQIHRIIRDNIRGRLQREGKTEHYREILEHVAQQSSACERRAQEAERESDRLKKAEYMSYHLGEEFEGIISGVTAYGFYVELPNTVEGLVHVTSLRDDYYSYNEETYELSGELSHKVYHLGQKVRVRVADADALKRTVDFTVVE